MKSLLRGNLISAGIIRFQPQFPVTVGGKVFHADRGDEESRLLFEADGFSGTADATRWRRTATDMTNSSQLGTPLSFVTNSGPIQNDLTFTQVTKTIKEVGHELVTICR